MLNSIEHVQRQYINAIQPVQLFKVKNSTIAQKNSFDISARLKATGNNPFHPDISNSNNGKRLDILS